MEENKAKKSSKAELELLSNRDVLRKAREMMQFHDNKLDTVDAIGKHNYFLFVQKIFVLKFFYVYLLK